MRVPTGIALALLCVACAGGSDGDNSAESTAVHAVPQTNTGNGIIFDPSTAKVGDIIGELTLDSIAATRAVAADSSFVGTARFRGEIELSGATLRHFEADMRDKVMCFEAGAASAARLPRWQGDERRPWFCFTNNSDALQQLGGASEGLAMTVLIDRFTIHRGLSDQVNEAVLVRRVR